MKVIIKKNEIKEMLEGLSSKSLVDLIALIDYHLAHHGEISAEGTRLVQTIRDMEIRQLVATREIISKEMFTRDVAVINARGRVFRRVQPTEDDDPPPPPRRSFRPPVPDPAVKVQDPGPPSHTSFTLEDRQMLRSLCERLAKLEIRRRPPPVDIGDDSVPTPRRRTSVE